MPDDEDVPKAAVRLNFEARGSHVRVGDLPGAAVLNADERAILTSACSAVIPSSGLMPAAGDVLVPLYVEAVCAGSPELSLLLRQAVKNLESHDLAASMVESLDALASTNAAAFELLKTLIYEGYYSQSTVLDTLEKTTGWRAGTVLIGSVMLPFDETLLRRVIGMPSSYRTVSKLQ